jgi:hypothetical protein
MTIQEAKVSAATFVAELRLTSERRADTDTTRAGAMVHDGEGVADIRSASRADDGREAHGCFEQGCD